MAQYCNQFEFDESSDEFILAAEPPEAFALYPSSNPGPPGPPGPPGQDGEGVPMGGTTGQLLAKASDEDFDTEWADVAADAGDIAYDDTETYSDGTVGKKLTDLNSAINAIQINKADVIISSASGAIASFSDGMNAPIKSLEVEIDPVQDLHGYDSPWPSGGGTNILPNINYNTSTFTLDNSGLYTQNDPSGAGWAWSYDNSVGRVRLKADTYIAAFYAETASQSTASGIKVFSSDNTELAGLTAQNGKTFGYVSFTLSQDTDIGIAIKIYTGKWRILIAKGSTAPASWSPYANLCPISGHTGVTVYRTGVNVWDEEWEVGDIAAVNGQNTDGSTTIRTKNYIPVVPGQIYYCKCQGTNTLRTRWYDKNKNYIGYDPAISYNSVFTVPSNAGFLRFTPQSTYGTTYNDDISINYPSTDHDYHAYTGTTYPITFPSEAGTVYGGTLTINEDGTGTLTVDRVCKLLRIARNLSGTYQGSIIYNSASAETSDADFAKPITCNRLKYVGMYPSSADWKYGTCINANFTSFNLWVKDGAFADLAEATAWLESNDTQLCYYLAQPQTYTLTAEQVGAVITTLKGQNNIWFDCGNTSAKYPCDTKLYIDGKLAELVAQIVNS